MCKQTELGFIEGTIGDLTFYKVGEQYYVRKKTSLTRKRVLKSPEFVRTRENAKEFRNGVLFMKLVRDSFGPSFLGIGRYAGRMHALLKGLIKTDLLHERGKRLCTYSELACLLGFEFVESRDASGLLPYLQIDVQDHSNSGTFAVSFVGLDCTGLTFPIGATHFKVSLAFGQLHRDFDTLPTGESFVCYAPLETPYLAPSDSAYSDSQFVNVHPIALLPYRSFLLLRLTYFQESAGSFYPIWQGQASQIIGVW